MLGFDYLFVFLAGIASAIGTFWILWIAARDGQWTWLLLSILLFPFVFPLYILIHFQKVRKPFLFLGLFMILMLQHLSIGLPFRDWLGENLGFVGLVLAMGALVWIGREGWSEIRWWVLTFFLFLPVLWFGVRYWRVAWKPIAVLCVGVLLVLAGALSFGDLIDDRHPGEIDRTLKERLFGCSGVSFKRELEKELKELEKEPKEEKERALERALLRGSFVRSLSAEFDLLTAHTAAMAAQLAYKPERDFNELARSLGLSETERQFIDVRNHVAVVLRPEQVVIVAFRGTDTIDDWFDDANIRQRGAEWGGSGWGRVHVGFADVVAAFWSDERWTALVDELQGAQQAVLLTGHSLGGALAAIAAARLVAEEGIEVAGLYTFGQPEIGNTDFVEQINDSIPAYFRVVHGQDDAVDLPPNVQVLMTIGISYEHGGQEIYLDSGGRHHLGGVNFPDSGRDVWCASEIHHHKMIGYLKYLSLLKSNSEQTL